MRPSSKTVPVTLKQVAQAAGVHFSTVSRALNPATRARVKPHIAARITETARRLGYRTNTLASSLRTRRSHVIGVVVPDIGSLLFPPILEGIELTLLKEGYMTIVANSANDPVRHRNILTGMIERQVDGLILATATLRDPILDEWIAGRAPVVLINRTDETGRVPAVINDDIRGIGFAVRHLAALGHTRIATIAGPSSLSTGAMRLRGFRLAISELALDPNPPVIEAPAFAREAGRAACLELLDAHPEITAIVAANDLLALGCYDACAQRGVSCPGHISITGYNDAPFVDLVDPPLTTVRIQQREMGIEAARLLLSRMNGQDGNADILLRPMLVQRRSTGVPRRAIA
ncbi:MAG TPA: LacI family DNA-binding transcriptional regulator [Xanthobacteraceae bacterium]|jgi:LacI family transcriptional regulator